MAKNCNKCNKKCKQSKNQQQRSKIEYQLIHHEILENEKASEIQRWLYLHQKVTCFMISSTYDLFRLSISEIAFRTSEASLSCIF